MGEKTGDEGEEGAPKSSSRLERLSAALRSPASSERGKSLKARKSNKAPRASVKEPAEDGENEGRSELDA